MNQPTRKRRYNYTNKKPKGIQSDSLLPCRGLLSNDEHEKLKGLTKCEVSRAKYVKVKLEHLRHLYRCAQMVQMGLNNRLNAAKGVCGDVSKVRGLEMAHKRVFDMIRDLVDDIEATNKIALTPSSFI